MERIIERILKFRSVIVGLFLAGTVLCGLAMQMVQVNYDIADYLPDEAPSTIALNTMDDTYDTAVPNLRVMVPDVSIPEALEYKEKLAAVKGVNDITWLDDQVNIAVPLEMQDQTTIADWYVGGDALFSIVVDAEGQIETLSAIREIIGEEGAMSGNPVDSVNAATSTGPEVQSMMMIIIPLMFVILLITTTSWFVPVVFMLNIGIAIVLNMGTNLIFGEISFITQTTGAVLQLACSMDYAIFLLDRFEEFKAEGKQPLEAMAEAILKSAASICSSGLTTVMGFAALCVMRFKVGPDMGVVLSKGIVISLVTTLVFMPCLVLSTYKLIDKTTHRSLMPDFKLLAKGANRFKTLATILVAIVVIPAFLGEQRIDFQYGSSAMAGPDSQVALDRAQINEQFGESTSFALMVPQGSRAKEQLLSDAIKDLPEVSSVLSYVESVGKSVPTSYLPEDTLKMLESGPYTRLVITARLPVESAKTFTFVETLRNLAQQQYPDEYLLAGEAPTIYDMRDTITADNLIVNLVAVGAIAVILLFTFQSVSIPIFLLITIESSIFINLSVPYFTGAQLNYIGYLVISSVQLGATVDYAILFANRYFDNRTTMLKRRAAFTTIRNVAPSILTSGGIMFSAGLILGFVSTNVIISQLGILLARGTALSMVLVIVFLPTQLGMFEKFIKLTSRKMTLYTAGRAEELEDIKEMAAL